MQTKFYLESLAILHLTSMYFLYVLFVCICCIHTGAFLLNTISLNVTRMDRRRLQSEGGQAESDGNSLPFTLAEIITMILIASTSPTGEAI